MRIPSGSHVATVIGVALVLVLGLSGPASAQCGMGGGGGHDHGAVRTTQTRKPASAKKQQDAVARLLADDQGRMILANALLEDRDFMWAFISRIVATPEWRERIAQRLDEAGDPAAAVPGPETATYTCPMHAEVTSAKPGPCPKCGMPLERQGAPQRAR